MTTQKIPPGVHSLLDCREIRRTNAFLDGLRSAGAGPVEDRKAIVFVHGIFSGPATFIKMMQAYSPGGQHHMVDHELWWYRYDYWDDMTKNGRRFADALKTSFSNGDRVTIIAHSMGGLIARLAALSERMNFLKRIVMLGTPNCGAIRTASLYLLSYMLHKQTDLLYAVFPRKRGISELTRVTGVFDDFRNKGGGDDRNAEHVEYITIPGMYFHNDRRDFALPSKGRGFVTFAPLIVRCVSRAMKRPHDGIVEVSSNSMIPNDTDPKFSEKTASICQRGKVKPATYVHLQTDQCKELTHTMIHCDDKIIELVADLLRFDTAEAWDESRSRSNRIQTHFHDARSCR